MKSIKFYDTSSLLIAGESAFKEKFVVSSITFKELEHIKSSSHKDAEVKYSARLLTRLFDENPSCYEVVLHRVEYEAPILKRGFEISDDHLRTYVTFYEPKQEGLNGSVWIFDTDKGSVLEKYDNICYRPVKMIYKNR